VALTPLQRRALKQGWLPEIMRSPVKRTPVARTAQPAVDPYLSAAQTVAAGMIDPQTAAINRAIEAKQRDIEAQGVAQKGVIDALASMGAGGPEAIRSAYQGAADRTMNYATGFTGAEGERVTSAAQQAAQSLAGMGIPGGVKDEGAAYGRTTNYLEGYLPSRSLAEEAASRLAEASTVRYAGGAALAQQALQQQNATRQEIDELRMRGLDIENTRPAEVQKALAALRGEGREERQVRIQERALQVQVGQLQLAQAKTKWDQAVAMTNLTGQIHQVRNGRIVNTGKIAAGSEAYVQAAEQAGSTQRAKLTNARIQEQNRISNWFRQQDLNIKKAKLKQAAAKEAKLKKGFFSQATIKQWKGQAGQAASNGFLGYQTKDADGNPKTVFTPAHTVLRQLISRGIPFSIAMDAILVYANKPNSRWAYARNWVNQPAGAAASASPR
jgi:hypothetical protein